MLLMTGGKERTVEEYRRLLARAGFRLNPVVPTSPDLSIIEALAD
jgi:C-methyltransferase